MMNRKIDGILFDIGVGVDKAKFLLDIIDSNTSTIKKTAYEYEALQKETNTAAGIAIDYLIQISDLLESISELECDELIKQAEAEQEDKSHEEG